MLTKDKLEALRKEMIKQRLDAYIVPSSDPHQSEYVSDHWKSRAWISGFTGSAGTAVISKTSSGVWTDSRYFIQAEHELADTEVKLHKVFNQGSPQFIDWIIENLSGGQVVGCDGTLFSKKQLISYKNKLAHHGITLEAGHDLISEIWQDRPSIPTEMIMELNETYCGESRESKLARVRAYMKEWNTDVHLISTLDDIAWLFNIRGNDVSYNPVAISYALIYQNKACLFINPTKVPKALSEKLNSINIEIKSYDEIWKVLNNLDESLTILIDENTISHKLYRAINTEKRLSHQLPTIAMKAIKNETECNHFRAVMEKDAVALTKFYIWLEENIDNSPTEYDLVQKIAHFRSLNKDYHSESFGAIVGYKGNGAIVHYSPSAETSATIYREGMLLIDSGGQYHNGTTDITRTISLGNTTAEEKNAYTRVLKGNIALDSAVFPQGTLGVQLDTLARMHLWQDQLNFLHGTGHGIGFFLNVHEGPQGFHPGIASRSKNSIDEHMVTTNEPGYYEPGKFGIRIENCLLTVKAGENKSGSFLKFETLTLFPIDTALIEQSIMTKAELRWINDYHQKVLERVSPHLSEDEVAWMKNKCKAI